MPHTAPKQRLFALLRRIIRMELPSELDEFDRYGLVNLETALADQLRPSALQKISWTSSGHIRAVRVLRSAALIAATVRVLGDISDSNGVLAENSVAEQELRSRWVAHMESAGLEPQLAQRIGEMNVAELLRIVVGP